MKLLSSYIKDDVVFSTESIFMYCVVLFVLLVFVGWVIKTLTKDEATKKAEQAWLEEQYNKQEKERRNK